MGTRWTEADLCIAAINIALLAISIGGYDKNKDEDAQDEEDSADSKIILETKKNDLSADEEGRDVREDVRTLNNELETSMHKRRQCNDALPAPKPEKGEEN
ncbi:hypothetical protein B0H13DRAFT_1890917 [Mycena leptocephala]|nr:hypothetical protein B0H13DRAFT_1890917 [Mycena leptocephala]